MGSGGPKRSGGGTSFKVRAFFDFGILGDSGGTWGAGGTKLELALPDELAWATEGIGAETGLAVRAFLRLGSSHASEFGETQRGDTHAFELT